MSGAIKPNLTQYGDSFSKLSYGIRTDESLTRGEINSADLNKSNLTDEVEFTLFEKTIRDFALGMLGHPVVRVEVSDFQLKIAIDKAISKLEYHAPYWFNQYLTFTTTTGVNLYELPLYVINNLSFVAYRQNLINSQYPPESFQSDMLMNFFRDNISFGNFAIHEFYLLQSWLETFKRVLGNDGSWDVVDGKYLQLYPTPTFEEVVIVEYRAIDTNTIHHAYRSWLQRYTLAIVKGIVGEIRSKYKSIPSPGGGATLNGESLKQESKQEMESLEKELVDEIEEPPLPRWF
jgi:hypothetical protein